MMHWVPRHHQQGFCLAKRTGQEMSQYEILKINSLLPANNNTQLVEVENFSSFEDLLCIPLKSSEEGGFMPYGPITMDTDYWIQDSYIAVNQQESGQEVFNTVNCNLQPNNDRFMKADHVHCMARNSDGISFHKYGDVIEFDIVNNVEGKNIMNNNLSNPIYNYNVNYRPNNTDLVTYSTMWAWPGKNRPYISRHTNFDLHTSPILNHRNMKRLEHHFFCMPPIKKPNGAQLGQRCSFVLEQEMQMTINFSQSYFSGNREVDMDQIHQDDEIQMRRAIFGKTKKVVPSEGPSPFCGMGLKMECSEITYEPGKRQKTRADEKPYCPLDNWAGLNSMLSRCTQEEINSMYTISMTDDSTDDNTLGPFEITTIGTSTLSKDAKIKQAWLENVNKDKKMLFITTMGRVDNSTSLGTITIYGAFISNEGSEIYNKYIYIAGSHQGEDAAVKWDFKAMWKVFSKKGLKCSIGGSNTMNATDYVTENLNIDVFYS